MPDHLQLFEDLVRVEIRLWDLADRRLQAEHGCTLSQLEFLNVIGRHGRCRVGDISAELGITSGGTSKIVDRLEAKGLVAREPNPEDRRSSFVTETAAGSTLRAEASKTLESALDASVGSVLSAAELGELAASLGTLRKALAAHPAHPPKEPIT